ncbi:MAG: Cobalt-precorrin-4 C(11)-methyltransferase [Planctomycetota bacterium]|jgi:precorrin-4 methylase
MSNRKSHSLIFLGLLLMATGFHVKAQEAAQNRNAEYYLVGIGPGDADLMTLRAVKTIQSADVIFCNPGVAARVSDFIKDKTVHLNHWGRVPFYGLTIDRVNTHDRSEFERIVPLRDAFIARVREYAQQGKRIVVLDSGDPMIYGPYTWTLEEFADLNPVVVAGLSSFNVANAALGKSVTNSRLTKSVTLTATDKFGRTDPIEKLAQVQNSMVVFTMRDEFESFVNALLKSYPDQTPMAIVRHAGVKDKETVIRTELGKALEAVKSDDLRFEYLIYIGEFLNFTYERSAEPVKP